MTTLEIINVEQGTPEWLWARAGIATASNFSKIVTGSKMELSRSYKDYAIKLASEKLVKELEEGFSNVHINRGHELEDEAVEAYEQHMFVSVDRVGFFKAGEYGYSPDGVVGKDGLIEIKCPMQKVHAKYLSEKRVPPEYYAQVQGGLYVTGREWCDFISYNPTFKDHPLFVYRAYPNLEFFKALDLYIPRVVEYRDEILKNIQGDRGDA